MAQRKAKAREIYFIRVDGIELGPFRSKDAAVQEAKQIRGEGAESVKIRTESISVSADLYSSGSDDDDHDDLDDLFEDEEEDEESGDDDDEEWEDLDDDDDEDEEEDEDEAPAVTHPFFRPIRKGKR